MNFGKKIKDLRLSMAVTQEQLAAALNVSAQAVSKWENNITLPDIQLLPELSVYFGVTIDELFDLTDEKHFRRIEHMLEFESQISEGDFSYAQSFLKEKISSFAAGSKGGSTPPNQTRSDSYSQALTLLSALYNRKADEYRNLAEYYAKESLETDPEKKENHCNLRNAQQGSIPDWDFSNHAKRISYYQDFVKKNPSYARGYLWLLDELLADYRLEEARQTLTELKKYDDTCRIPLYEGKIAWADGKQQEALSIWEAMTDAFPNDWLAHSCQGDCLAHAGRYREAIPCYERAKKLQPAPRYTDSDLTRAQIYEILGEYDNAISAWKDVIRLLATDWNTIEGSTVEEATQEITRLKGLL